MLKSTLGQLLVNDALPPDLRDYSRKLDKKGTGKLFQEVAERYPEQYKEIAKKLSDVGRDAATESGGYSFGPDSLVTPEKVRQLKLQMQASVDRVLRSDLDDAKKRERVVAIMQSKT